MRTKSIISAIFVAIVLSLAAACTAAPSGIPQAKAGSLLRKIQDRGRLIVGVKYDIPSFGFLNQQATRVEGFDPAIAHEISAYIFGNPNNVEFKEALTKDREAKLQDGTYDLALATFIINEERLKVIDFSIPYYQSGPRLLVTQDSNIKSIADVDGRKVGLATGSAYISVVTKTTKATIVQIDNNAASVQELTKHNIDAFVSPDFTAYGLALTNPSLKVVGPQFSQDYFGAGIAKGNPELLEAVNTVIKNLKASGKWKTLWKAEIGDKFGITTIPEPPPDDWK